MKYLLILVLLTQQAFGYEVKFLQKDQPAPYDGYLFEPKAEKELRLLDSEFVYQKKLTVSLEQINKSYEEQVQIMQSRITNQSKQIQDLQDNNGMLSKYGFFVLGVVSATLMAYAINQGTK